MAKAQIDLMGVGGEEYKTKEFTAASNPTTIDIGESYSEAYLYGTNNATYNNVGMAYINQTNNTKSFLTSYNGLITNGVTLSGNTISLNWSDSFSSCSIKVVYK